MLSYIQKEGNSMMKQYETTFLKNHGITKENYHEKLFMTEDEIPSASTMKNATAFAAELKRLLIAKKRICIYGDYDTDGVTATVVMVRGLRLLSKALTGDQGKISYWINDRFEDGYGMTSNAVDHILQRNPKLNVVITVDNGVVAFDAIKHAVERNLEVLVTDHHKGLEELPVAKVIVDPSQIGETCQFKDISGCTVAYKLLLLTAETYAPKMVNEIKKLVDFVGVSVVSDVMPMLYENRVYVKKAVKIFNRQDSKIPLRFGWYALIERLYAIKKLHKDHDIDETDFGWLFSPIINAQSRVEGKANIGVDLFLSTDSDDVREKAKYMIEVNESRKEVSNAAFAEISQTINPKQSIIIVRNDEVGEGIIGLLGSKITDLYNRPSIVVTAVGNNKLKGSARSIQGVDITDTLRKLNKDDKFMSALGGHSGAAGMTFNADQFEEFKKQAIKAFDQLVPKDLAATVKPDLIIDSHDVTLKLIKDFQKLAPFGEDFKFPNIEVLKLPIDKVELLGKDKSHLKLTTETGIKVIVWNDADKFKDDAISNHYVNVIANPQINDFMGSESLQLVVVKDEISFSN